MGCFITPPAFANAKPTTLVGIWSSCSAAACNTPYSARFSPRCIAHWARSARIPFQGRLLPPSFASQNPPPLLRRATLVGTRSPYSLPFVILPAPARSPFRFIRHRRRSTPNLTQNSKNVHFFAPRDLWLWGENCCIMLASARRYESALKKGYTHEKIA